MTTKDPQDPKNPPEPRHLRVISHDPALAATWATNDAALAWLGAWLDGWQSENRIPARCCDRIPMAIEAAERRLQPLTDQTALAVLLDPLMEFADAFGLFGNGSAEDIERRTETATRMYLDALSGLPADLVREAVESVREGHRWGGRLPLPADLVKSVEPEMQRRRMTLMRLRTAEMRIRQGEVEHSDEDAEPTEEQKARVAGMLAEAAKHRAPAWEPPAADTEIRRPIPEEPKPIDRNAMAAELASWKAGLPPDVAERLKRGPSAYAAEAHGAAE